MQADLTDLILLTYGGGTQINSLYEVPSNKGADEKGFVKLPLNSSSVPT